MRVRATHVVTIDSRKSIIVIAILSLSPTNYDNKIIVIVMTIISSVTKSLPSSLPVPSNSRSALSNTPLPTTSRRTAHDNGVKDSSGRSNRPKHRRMRK